MKLIKINDSEYKVSDKGIIKIDKDNFLHFDFNTAILIEIFDRFKEKIKKDYIFYKGDNVFLRENYYTNNEGLTIIFLRKYKFMVKSEYLKEENYLQIFKEKGNWQEAKDDDKDVDFLFIQGPKFSFDKKFWNINSIISNKLNREGIEILKKNNLDKIVNSKFLNQQFKFTLSPKFNSLVAKNFIENKKVVILKPVDGFAGMDIEVINNYQDFEKRIKELKKIKNKDKWSDKKGKWNNWNNRLNWVLETYIIDPYLYQGKKTHFRTFYINTSEGQGYIYNKHRIAIAEEEFKLEDFKNKKIHDTHFLIKDDNIQGSGLVFLNDLLDKENYDNVMEQVIMIFKDITRNIKLKTYPESVFGFEIFAADLILKQDLSVKLIEINTNPGFNRVHYQAIEIFDSIMTSIVDDILPPKNKNEKESYLIPVNKKTKTVSDQRSPKGLLNNDRFIDQISEAWYQEGYGPRAKKDRTGGYYLSCKGKKQEVDENHIHIVGSNGKYHKNSWSRKVKERRRWEALDFRLSAREQAYHIYVKSNFSQDKECLDYYKTHKK